jgi:hypothetical protein
MSETRGAGAARLAQGAAAVVATAAVVGSVSALLAIAARSEMSAPWSLPVSLDLTGLVAALVIRHRRRDVLAWVTLLVTVGTSTTLQVLTAPADPVARVAHGVVPLAALVSFELAMRVARPVPVQEPVAVKEPLTTKPKAKAVRTPPVPIEDLLPVAEHVAAELVIKGRQLTPTAMREGLRAAGYSVGHGRAVKLLDLVRPAGVVV